MTRWSLVVVCAIGLAAGCDDDSGPEGTGGTGGGDAAAGTGGTGTGGTGTGGTGTGGTGTGGTGTGGTGTGGSTGGSSATGGAGGSAMDAGGDSSAAAAMITAATGGTLSTGGASLLIPAGVLTADQMLTVSVHTPTASDPGRANIVGDIYDFGPNGTTFRVPVQLTLPIPGAIPADKKALVAWLEESTGEWFPVSTTVSGDKAIGLVTHFTRFALLVIPKEEICPYAGACGGSLDGTWKYSQTCLKATEKEAFKCGDAGSVTMRNEFFVNGTVTVASGRFTANQMIEATGTLFYTPACMTVLRQSLPTANCATLQEAWRKENAPPGMEHPWICQGTVEQGCSCRLTQNVSQTIMGAVTTTGNKVNFTKDGDQPGTPDDYCVKGNNLSVRTDEGEVYTAVKQ